MTLSSHPTPPQDAVLLTPALCMGSHQPPSLTESKNIKLGPICRPTDERRCALDFRGDWQPVKAVRRGTCCPDPPTSAAPPCPRILAAKTTPSSGRGWLLPPPGAGPTKSLTPPAGRLGPPSSAQGPAGPLCLEPPLWAGPWGYSRNRAKDSTPNGDRQQPGTQHSHLRAFAPAVGTLSLGAMWPTLPPPSDFCSDEVETKQM